MKEVGKLRELYIVKEKNDFPLNLLKLGWKSLKSTIYQE